jgi:hypothetical protein
LPCKQTRNLRTPVQRHAGGNQAGSPARAVARPGPGPAPSSESYSVIRLPARLRVCTSLGPLPTPQCADKLTRRFESNSSKLKCSVHVCCAGTVPGHVSSHISSLVVPCCASGPELQIQVCSDGTYACHHRTDLRSAAWMAHGDRCLRHWIKHWIKLHWPGPEMCCFGHSAKHELVTEGKKRPALFHFRCEH